MKIKDKMLPIGQPQVKVEVFMCNEINKSKSFNSEDYNDKRFKHRVDFNLDIFYPQINSVSVHNEDSGEPLIQVVNISETGICILSKVLLAKDDFVSFTLKIEERPSFWCLCQVKWAKICEDGCLAGAEFYTLNAMQLETVRDYVNKR